MRARSVNYLEHDVPANGERDAPQLVPMIAIAVARDLEDSITAGYVCLPGDKLMIILRTHRSSQTPFQCLQGQIRCEKMMRPNYAQSMMRSKRETDSPIIIQILLTLAIHELWYYWYEMMRAAACTHQSGSYLSVLASRVTISVTVDKQTSYSYYELYLTSQNAGNI